MNAIERNALKLAGASPRECIEKAMAEDRRVFWVESLADIGEVPGV